MIDVVNVSPAPVQVGVPSIPLQSVQLSTGVPLPQPLVLKRSNLLFHPGLNNFGVVFELILLNVNVFVVEMKTCWQ